MQELGDAPDKDLKSLDLQLLQPFLVEFIQVAQVMWQTTQLATPLSK